MRGSDPKVSGNLPAGILVAATCGPFFLCFVYTNIVPVGNTALTLFEATILGLGTMYLLARNQKHIIYIAPALLFWFALLSLFRGAIDLHGPRNLLIIFVFLLLGAVTGDPQRLDRIVSIICGIVLLGALAEFFMTERYLHYFDILDFYVSRAGEQVDVPAYLDKNLFISGMRPTERYFVPFLGNQRISSVFLEPVSMGNFAVIVSIWGLSLLKDNTRKGAWYVLLAFVFVIASDSRFAGIMIVSLLLVRFVPWAQSRVALAVLPFVASAGLIVHAALRQTERVTDDLPGRLAVSAHSMIDMDVVNLMGLGPLHDLDDMGITYSIESYGLLLALVLWFALVCLPVQTEQGKSIKAMVAYYAIGILAVSGTSLYSMKTAALLWFIVGTFVGRAGQRPDQVG
jgi:putative polymerase